MAVKGNSGLKDNKEQKRQEGINSKIREAENSIRSNPYETKIIFDNDGNELARLTQDKETSVEYRLIDVWNRISTHNHPNGSAPSPDDIDALWVENRKRIVSSEWENEFRRNSQNLDSYALRVGGTWYNNGQEFKNAYKKAVDTIFDRTKNEWLKQWEKEGFKTTAFGMTSRQYTWEKANYRLRVWLYENAPKYGWTFSFKRVKGDKRIWEK